MDLVNLVDFIISWEQGEERDNLKEHAAHSPQVHLVTIVAVCQQALWRSVPPRGNVLGVRLLGINSPARSKISQLHVVFAEQNVFGLDVSMENSVSMHVINCLYELVHVVLDPVFRQVVALALYCVVQVHIH